MGFAGRPNGVRESLRRSNILFSRTGRYALQAMSCMAKHPLGYPLKIEEVSWAGQIPSAYLAKIFQGLVRVGLLTSRRGPRGGYVLKKDPSTVSLLDIINATDSMEHSPLTHCVVGLGRCQNTNPCNFHTLWTQTTRKIKERLEKTSLKEFSGATTPFRSGAKTRRILSPQIRGIFH